MKTVSPQELFRCRTAGEEVDIIDVREPFEFAGETIEGSISAPLSKLESDITDRRKDVPVFLICRSGARAEKAGARLIELGFSDVRVVDGGLLAWKEAGFPVIKGDRNVWSLERQVRAVAGGFVLAGAILAWFVHPAFVAVPAFVGAGLLFSGITNTCGLALLLGRMPWNRCSPSS